MSLQGNNITFKSEDKDIKGFFAHPDDSGKYPGVIVIHEIFGLNENIKEITRKFANEGYAALAVDLFSGDNVAVCILNTMKMFITHEVNNSEIQYLLSGIDYLSEKPFVDPAKIGAIGFCMGGNFAIAMAYQDKRVKTIAPFYGTRPSLLKDYSQLCPTVGSYPEMDFTRKEGEKLEEGLQKTDIPHDIKIYPKVFHSFMNDHSPLTYNAEAAKDAWDRTFSFFNKHLVNK